ncbi:MULTISPECIES: 3-hydroxyacyl-ACP dehydratase FabZ [Lactobacillus]|uniref:3-hydroxyacyl-ACP dehydratase FabZ n=1 Tax=Lactobacillus xujianguonis TaxID=2495899 RepID=A0A437STT0_9LACO|nr:MULTISPECIES: 3-hydroxyacyl-ACP dehydratase FabZ [Lactobacillus]RVU70330.1 3-hydroxyacyl-ACP dehydratase FabZ [Lactobacillus xujianguonis]RVU76873.1 3-hydroxyacyl-ACP dehydratase FabZ [Lactobacillus xujianguonis]
MTELGIAEIEKIIPHHYPMLLIDRVTELKAGLSAQALHSVNFNEPFVHASSKTNPVFPAPLIIEALAQTGAVALLSKNDFAGKTAYFGGIKQAEFFGDVHPGDQLVLTTRLTKIKRNIGVGQGVATVNGRNIAEAELTFMIG